MRPYTPKQHQQISTLCHLKALLNTSLKQQAPQAQISEPDSQ